MNTIEKKLIRYVLNEGISDKFTTADVFRSMLFDTNQKEIDINEIEDVLESLVSRELIIKIEDTLKDYYTISGIQMMKLRKEGFVR
jgi:hypothetical protein